MRRLTIAGIGFPTLISAAAEKAIRNAEVVVGYKKYTEEIKDIISQSQEVFSNGMREEVDRVAYAVEQACKGRLTCVVCSGDPSLFGMAALAYELAEGKDIEIEVLPSVTAAMAASAKLGAPVTDDLLLLSLSDQLTPWEVIQKRIEAVNLGDLVCAIYNPRSKTRTTQLQYALSEFRKRGNLIVGSVRNAYRDGEHVAISTIDEFDIESVDMFTLVLVGNTATKLIEGKMVTPRGYKI